jgi:hypothetical protein
MHRDGGAETGLYVCSPIALALSLDLVLALTVVECCWFWCQLHGTVL